jgi:hypothetical protein
MKIKGHQVTKTIALAPLIALAYIQYAPPL